MIVWHAYTTDHRLLDSVDEGSGPDLFASSRASAIDQMRALVIDALAPVDETDDVMFPAVQPDNPEQPVEVYLVRHELAQCSPKVLALALLNRRGWSRRSERESVWISCTGRLVSKPEIPKFETTFALDALPVKK